MDFEGVFFSYITGTSAIALSIVYRSAQTWASISLETYYLINFSIALRGLLYTEKGDGQIFLVPPSPSNFHLVPFRSTKRASPVTVRSNRK